MPPDVPSYLSSQGTLSDRQETVLRTEGGHQANGHIESNGKASKSDVSVPISGRWPAAVSRGRRMALHRAHLTGKAGDRSLLGFWTSLCKFYEVLKPLGSHYIGLSISY